MTSLTGLFQRPQAMAGAMVVFCCVLTAGSVKAQDNLDPNDIWYRGFLLVQASRDSEDKGDYLSALAKINEAIPLYDHLAQMFPDFQPEIVRERRHLNAEKRDEIKQAMRNPPPTQPSPRLQPQPQPVPRPQPQPVNPATAPNFAETIPSPPLPTYGSARSRSMEIEDPDQEFSLPSWDDGASQALPRVATTPGSGMPRVETRRAPSVGAIANSLHEDLSQKDSLISWLNNENLKLRTQLSRSEAELEAVRGELTQAQSNVLDLNRRVAQAESSAGGVTQQRIDELKSLLRDATNQLQQSVDRNSKLVAALDQSQAEMKKMRSRLVDVERERDNLAEVVRGEANGGKALKELMDRNRDLTLKLDRAEQLATSLSELSKNKDQDIAMLKTEIARIRVERDKLLSDNLDHQQTIEELKQKLEMLSDGLTQEERNSIVSASPVERQENELLRSLVLKQLRRQAQMKQAKELLLRQLDKVGTRSDTLLGLVDDMATGSQLTEEEKALFKSPQFQEIVDAASSSEPFSPAEAAAEAVEASNSNSETLIAAGTGSAPVDVVEGQKVSIELSQIEKAARLDFSEGRYSEAEAGFLEYLRYRPRNVACLCNLGVLKIAVKNYSEAEYFLEKALAIESDSGLAHYLLGRTYFLQNKLDEALTKLEEGLTFDPQNAKAHNTLGVISTRKGWVARAEKAFTSAVSINPKYGDAHFNLAVLYVTRDEPNAKAAEKHYFEALHLGVPRDAAIEDFLSAAEAAGPSIGMIP
ncbi:MAG: tetratricopeptide repeat protein [Verrucomicrobiales bacterium]|nr:tetratricopeptide repeat protein [Verrucomicrobiales bacterium]